MSGPDLVQAKHIEYEGKTIEEVFVEAGLIDPLWFEVYASLDEYFEEM